MLHVDGPCSPHALHPTHPRTRSGWVDSKGPRYCPSIEDKIVRFADKQSHQIFLEPEGRTTPELYVQVSFGMAGGAFVCVGEGQMYAGGCGKSASKMIL